MKIFKRYTSFLRVQIFHLIIFIRQTYVLYLMSDMYTCYYNILHFLFKSSIPLLFLNCIIIILWLINWCIIRLFLSFIYFTDTVVIVSTVIAVVIVIALGAFGLVKLSISVRLVLNIKCAWFMSDFAITS